MTSLRRLAPAAIALLLGLSHPVQAQDAGPRISWWDPRFDSALDDDLGFLREAEAIAENPLTGDVFVGGPNRLRGDGQAVVRWTGDGWEAVGGAFDRTVHALAVGPDGTLYAGGRFTTIGGVGASRVARFNGVAWEPLGNGVDGDVRALAVEPATGDLYVGGNFLGGTDADGTIVISPDLVRWTGASWERVGHGNDGRQIEALAFDPVSGDLFVGGELHPGMRNADSTLADIQDIGRFDGSTWEAVEDESMFGVEDLAFDDSGHLWMVQRGGTGFARWNRVAWTVPAGGLGYVRESGRRLDADGTSLAIGADRIYVGGLFSYVTQPDGSVLLSRGLVAYDPDTDRFEGFGEGIDQASTAGHRAAALLARPHGSGGEELFVAGSFSEAGAVPANGIARLLTRAPFPATEATFRVDLRTPMRLGLFGNISFLYPTTRRPMVDVLTGAGANRYLLYDSDGDSVWTARVAQPRSETIAYAFALDASGGGFERDTDWVYEKQAPDTPARSTTFTAAPAHTLPVVRFDDFAARSVDPDWIQRDDRRFEAGDPRRERFPAGGSRAVVTVDPERLDRPMQLVVRWYEKDPGGGAPEGLAGVARSGYWSIDHAPQSADYAAEVVFDYGEIPGVAEPNDLRLLHRSDAESPWQIVTADVDPNALVVSTIGVTALAGDWTVGSVSGANPLSSDPPAVVSDPTPSDGALTAPVRPLLRWEGGPDAATHDVYLWPAQESEPNNPGRTGITSSEVQWLVDLDLGVTYHWRIVARNINGDTPGPVWSFTVGSVPDLAVTTLVVPTGALSGQEMLVEWTVSNLGDGSTNVPIWYEDVFLSDSPTLQLHNAKRLARRRNVAALGPGDSYASGATVVLPDGIQGPRYIHVATDAADAMSEFDESGNTATREVAVTLAPYADLQVQQVLAPSAVFSGDEIDVTYTVVNAGNGRTSATTWLDSIFLSEDETFDFEFIATGSGFIRITEHLLGQVERVGALAPGESYDASASVQLPDGVVGTPHLFVVADIPGGGKQKSQGAVYEYNQDLNNWTARALSSTLTPPPDLVVTSVVPPTQAQSGEYVDVRWTVENVGAGPTRADQWQDLVYYSPTAGFDTTAVVGIGSFSRSEPLSQDAAYVRTGRVRIPDGVEGDGFFFVHADVAGSVFEHTFEANNVGGSTAAATVTRSPYPDLVVGPITVSNPEVTAGEQVAVTYTVENRGTAPVSRWWQDTVYLLPQSSWDPGVAVTLMEVRRESPFEPGGSRLHTVAVTIPPEAVGTMYLFVGADLDDRVFEYPDDRPNVSDPAELSVAAYPPVDLRASFGNQGPEARTGQLLELAHSVSNVGTGRARPESWLDRFYLSSDASLDPEVDRLIATIERVTGLEPGAGYTHPPIRLPDDLHGDLYLIAQADAGGDVIETDEENNVAMVPLRVILTDPADLWVSDVSVPAQAEAGRMLTVQWTVTNQGAGATRSRSAGGAWFDAVYLSPDGRLGRNEVLLGTRERIGPLEPGGGYVAELEVSLPPTASGPYAILVQTDRRDDVYEHLAEGNNAGSSGLEVTLPAPADLVVTSVLVPQTAEPGEAVTVSWILANQGPNPARGMVREVVFVSPDDRWDVTDPALGVFEREIDLAPGAQLNVALKVDAGQALRVDAQGEVSEMLPGVLPGDYHLLVRTDIADTVRETQNGNNTGVSEDRMEVSIPVLAPGVDETIALGAGESRTFRIDASGPDDVRVGLASSDPDAAVELFAADGRIPTPGGDFDLASATPFQAVQSLVIPGAGTSSWYVVAVGRSGAGDNPSPQTTVRADLLAFGITDLSVDRAGDRGEVSVVIRGARFSEDAEVFLERGGHEPSPANLVSFESSTELLARLPTNDLALGAWDVVVRNPGGERAVLEAGLTIDPASPGGLQLRLDLPAAARVGRATDVTLVATNPSNVNVERAAVLIRVPAGLELLDVLDPERPGAPFWNRDTDLFEDTQAEVSWTLVYLSNIRPGTDKRLYLTVRSGTAEAFGIQLNRVEFTRSQFFWKLLNAELEAFRSGEYAFFSEPPEEPAGKWSGSVLNECDACQDMQNEADRIVCEYRKRAGFVADKGKDYAWEEFGKGPRSPRPGLWPKLFCAPTGVDPCSDETPPNMPCFCEGVGNCVPDFPVPELPFLQSFDPNDVVGPDGIGPERWVARDQTLSYTVRFENDPDLATAPAQTVTISHPLDPEADGRRFRLGPFGFGSFSFNPPENTAYYTTRLDLVDSLGLFVDVAAGLDVLANRAFWVFETIDPATGTQPANDPFAGFLPVNDESGAGEGFAMYTIAPDETASTGDVVTAQARIVFDINPPLDTPEVFNTIDATPPVSSVSVQPGRQDTTAFRVSWSGSDEGSGVRDYELFVSTDDGPFERYQSATDATSLLFIAEQDRTYRFFTLATDQVGNREPMKTEGEAVTVVGVEDEEPGLPASFALHQNYPNPFNPRTTIPFDLAERGNVTITVYNVLGQRVLVARNEPMTPGHYQQIIDLSGYASGIYFYEIRVLGQGVRFRDVRKLVLVK